MDDSEGHSKWKLQPHVDSLAALLRSRDERALRIVEEPVEALVAAEKISGTKSVELPGAIWLRDEIKRRLEAPDAE